MALRVLLADESSTIRKAVQMVLSDYGVDIKTVPTGIDVLSVTKSFDPDVILADVLLTKKNGYEVSLELKTDESTKHIPIIIMWSSFMQLDLTQFLACKANDSLEKPFDAETIRGKIEALIPNLKSHPFKGFLNLPRLPDMIESETFVRQRTSYDSLPDTAKASIRAVAAPELPPAENKPQDPAQSEDGTPKEAAPKKVQQKIRDNDDWSPAKTKQFIIETENFGEYEEVKAINSIEDEPDLQAQINEQIQDYIKDSPVVSHRAKDTFQKSGYSSFDEQLIREEIRQIAERICWQVIPEVTEKVVREELAKLLKGIESST